VLDWSNKLITDQGVMTLKDLATTYCGKTVKDYHNRWFTSQIKTDKRFVAQAANFRIVPEVELRVKNERGDWMPLEYLYFHGSTEYIFKVHFFAPNLKQNSSATTNEFVVRCLPRQMFLVYGGSTLKWKKVSEFAGISKENIKLRNDNLHYAEYMGAVKTNYRTQLVSVQAKDSLGVCLEPGIVALSAT
jgi:hypothetical protein